MSHFFIINGILNSCGLNDYGQLGLGHENGVKIITQVTNPNRRFVSISNYDRHTMAIDEDGYLWSCGHNGSGQLGLNDNVDRLVLTQVYTTQTFQAVACGDHHTAAIDREGFLWVCGKNDLNQLGLGNNESKISLTKVNDNKFIVVNCAAYHTMVIDEDGFLWGCGRNYHGQLGLGSYEKVEILTLDDPDVCA